MHIHKSILLSLWMSLFELFAPHTYLYIYFKIMPRVPIASEDERKFIVEGIQVGRVNREIGVTILFRSIF